MAAPTITIRLSESVSGDTVTFSAPAPELPFIVRKPGKTHLTAGGGIAQYRVGGANHEVMLSIPSLTKALMNSLELFFRTHWGKATISYRDENVVTFAAVRFLDEDLEIVKIGRNMYSTRLHMRFPSAIQ